MHGQGRHTCRKDQIHQFCELDARSVVPFFGLVPNRRNNSEVHWNLRTDLQLRPWLALFTCSALRQDIEEGQLTWFASQVVEIGVVRKKTQKHRM